MDILINDITMKYINSNAFHFPDHCFKKNQITVITGRNGSGKTTLMKIIAQLIKQTTGNIQYEEMDNVSNQITYVSQEPYLLNMTAYKNIIYPLKIRKEKIKEYQESINYYAKKLNIEDIINKNCNDLSSGEKMKVSIIRGIIFNPKVLLLDEPTTHLDMESIYELGVLIKELKKNMNIILISHNKFFVDSINDEIYSLGSR